MTPTILSCLVLARCPERVYTDQVNHRHPMSKQLDLAAIMASYTAQHNEMMARSAANRKAFAEGRPFPFPAAPTTTWNISDRH